ncbi:MAG TPA: glycosyltransferase [Puia sp.]|nr:glycosyltransferase [Puia sp.]
MKILIVGSDKVYSIENFYVRHMRQAGADVRNFPAQRFFYDHYQKSIVNKIIFRAGLSGILRRINAALLKEVEAFRPSVVWVFKGMEIYPSTLEKIRQRGIKLVNYNPDNPFIFSGAGSGNKHVQQSIGLYDLHFTYNLAIRDQLEKQYGMRTAFLPFGYELDDREYLEFAKEKEVSRVCFAGNPDAQRASFLMSLLESGIPIDVIGNDWDKFIRHPLAGLYGPVYKDAFWRVLRKYRVQLNLLRIHNEDSHNMRTFEAPGVGGIMLAPRTTEHMLFFTDGEDAFLYGDLDECKEKINYLLSMPEGQAAEIRARARARSVTAGYSYRDRAMHALNILEGLNA